MYQLLIIRQVLNSHQHRTISSTGLGTQWSRRPSEDHSGTYTPGYLPEGIYLPCLRAHVRAKTMGRG